VDLAALRATVAADHEVADRAHDVSHLDRVAALAGWIAEQVGADVVMAQVAGYVHDYHRVAEARTGIRPLPAHAANDLVCAVLDAHQIPRCWRPDILRAVEVTGRYRIAGDWLPADLVEACPVAAAVHDADNLDALGVVGLARAVSYGAVLGEPLWEPAAALRSGCADGRTSSVVAHCYEKLVHLADEMLTEPARRLAERRLDDLLGVLGKLRAELAAHPAQGASWDPRTGYLRVPLRPVPGTASDCKLEFNADVRLGLRRRAPGGQVTVCYVELSALPAVARSMLTGLGPTQPVAGGVRIPVRPNLADRVVAGPGVVLLELGDDLVRAVTLHLRTRGASLDHA
jgi:uncharacterized protein